MHDTQGPVADGSAEPGSVDRSGASSSLWKPVEGGAAECGLAAAGRIGAGGCTGCPGAEVCGLSLGGFARTGLCIAGTGIVADRAGHYAGPRTPEFVALAGDCSGTQRSARRGDCSADEQGKDASGAI